MLQAVQYGQAMKHKQVTNDDFLSYFFFTSYENEVFTVLFRSQKSIHNIVCLSKKRHRGCLLRQRIRDILVNSGKFPGNCSPKIICFGKIQYQRNVFDEIIQRLSCYWSGWQWIYWWSKETSFP